MAIVSHESQLIYFDVPKVACTTLKTHFYELANGPPDKTQQPSYKDRVKKAFGRAPSRTPVRWINNQEGYRTLSYERALREQELPNTYTRIAIVRDPIARFYSAWANKANEADFARRKELEDLRNEGLPTSPDFGEYLDNYEGYQIHSRSVRVHNKRYAWHLGDRVSSYDHIFKIEDMAELENWLSARENRPIQLPYSNRSKRNKNRVELTAAQKKKLTALTAPDYAWLGDRYDAQTALDRLTS